TRTIGTLNNMASTLCFGIDFGTTYSGVAWAWSGQPQDINIVTSWPSKLIGNSDREKTPTEIQFETTTRTGSKRITWGYDVPSDSDPFRWFKLLLVNEDQLQPHLVNSKQLKEARQRLQNEGLQPVQAVAIYLREIWNHTLEHVRRMLQDAVDECRFHIVLTVPAIWKDGARKKMQEAARQAGLLDSRACGKTTMQLLSEPEAGAISTFATMEGRPDIHEGDAMVVVDAGGGIVDLISYKVDSLSPFVLSECAEGTGGLCGAVFLDQGFMSWLEQFSPLAPVWSKTPVKDLKLMIRDSWEHGIKQEFNGQDKEFTIPLPYSCALQLNESDLTLKSEQLTDILDHVICEIEALVGKQVKAVKKRLGKPPKYIILVGGFGRCTGPTPWTAVCRGAVIHALITTGGFSTSPPVQVSTRISRANYGIAQDLPFRLGKHPEADRYTCPYEGTEKARNQMKWYMLRGDETSKMSPKAFMFCRYYEIAIPPPLFPTLDIDLFTCTDMSAPSRLQGSKSIKRLDSIKFTCPVSFWELPIETSNSGNRYRCLTFRLEMTTDGSSATFQVFPADELVTGLSRLLPRLSIGQKTIDVECDKLSVQELVIPKPEASRNSGPRLRRSKLNLAVSPDRQYSPQPHSPFDSPVHPQILGEDGERRLPSSPRSQRRGILYQMPSSLGANLLWRDGL
ncbi:actin-like ATPase domain-containing protein, partial [Podospora fimiseda]